MSSAMKYLKVEQNVILKENHRPLTINPRSILSVICVAVLQAKVSLRTTASTWNGLEWDEKRKRLKRTYTVDLCGGLKCV